MPLVTLLVELADCRHAQDFLPTVLLAEDVEHLGLFAHGAQTVGMGRVGQAQEQTLVVRDNIKQIKLTCLYEQRAVEIIGQAVQRIIGCIKRTIAFEQLCLVLQARGTEQTHGFLRGTGDAMERQVSFHNLVHALPQGIDQGGRHSAVDKHAAVVTVRHRRVDAQAGRRIKVVERLVEHEEKRTRVGAQARGRRDVEKLHVLIVEEHEVKAFHLVVHLGARGSVRHVELEHLINLFERKTHGHLMPLTRILTTYSDGLSHNQCGIFQCYVTNLRHYTPLSAPKHNNKT